MSRWSEIHSATSSTTSDYTQEERKLLLQLAHRSIEAALQGRELDLKPPSPHLGEMRGAFTTLHLDGRLRGCIGYLVPMHPLYRTVAETAQSAAFDDPRFPPVTPEEAPHLISIVDSVEEGACSNKWDLSLDLTDCLCFCPNFG